MRTLILSCSTGEGHNSCAKAIKEIYDANAEYCIIKDVLSFISDKTADFFRKDMLLCIGKSLRSFGWAIAMPKSTLLFFWKMHLYIAS